MSQVNSGTEHSGGVGLGSLNSQAHGSLVGRELDAAVAERVMGWKHGRNDTYCDHPFVSCPVCTTRFSTDIAAAMQVIEKADTWMIVGGQGKFTASFGVEQPNGDLRYFNKTAPSVPEAICRAALAAVESRERATQGIEK